MYKIITFFVVLVSLYGCQSANMGRYGMEHIRVTENESRASDAVVAIDSNNESLIRNAINKVDLSDLKGRDSLLYGISNSRQPGSLIAARIVSEKINPIDGNYLDDICFQPEKLKIFSSSVVANKSGSQSFEALARKCCHVVQNYESGLSFFYLVRNHLMIDSALKISESCNEKLGREMVSEIKNPTKLLQIAVAEVDKLKGRHLPLYDAIFAISSLGIEGEKTITTKLLDAYKERMSDSELKERYSNRTVPYEVREATDYSKDIERLVLKLVSNGAVIDGSHKNLISLVTTLAKDRRVSDAFLLLKRADTITMSVANEAGLICKRLYVEAEDCIVDSEIRWRDNPRVNQKVKIPREMHARFCYEEVLKTTPSQCKDTLAKIAPAARGENSAVGFVKAFMMSGDTQDAKKAQLLAKSNNDFMAIERAALFAASDYSRIFSVDFKFNDTKASNNKGVGLFSENLGYATREFSGVVKVSQANSPLVKLRYGSYLVRLKATINIPMKSKLQSILVLGTATTNIDKVITREVVVKVNRPDYSAIESINFGSLRTAYKDRGSMGGSTEEYISGEPTVTLEVIDATAY